MATFNEPSQIQKTPFVKELASSDRKMRDKALESLTLFLRARRDLSQLEMLKIWKGLFFCFYHSDRPLTQQALARALSYFLVPSLTRGSRLQFLRAFWITIGREFHALDRLRLDKYLFLIRCYVGVAFEVFLKKNIVKKTSEKEEGTGTTSEKKRKRKGADGEGESGKRRKNKIKKAQEQSDRMNEEEEDHDDDREEEEDDDDDDDEAAFERWSDLESYITILEEGPLCPLNFDPSDKPKSKKTTQFNSEAKNLEKKEEEDSIPIPHGPDGLRYHITDIWLDELAKVIDTDETAIPLKERYDIPIDLLLRPFEKLRTESPTKTVRERAKGEVLEDERLVEWGFREKKMDDGDNEDDSDSDGEAEWDGFD